MSKTGFQVILNSTEEITNSFSFFNPNVLIIGAKDANGTATSGSLVENIIAKNDIKTKFGVKSEIYECLNFALNFTYNRFNQDKIILNAIGYDITGNNCIKNIALSGTPQEGIIKLYVGNYNNNTIQIITSATDTLSQIATKIETELKKLETKLFAVETDTTNVVITLENPGVWGNNLPVGIITNTSGISLTISTTTAGTGTIDISNLITTIQDKKFDAIVIDSTLINNNLITELQNRINTLTYKSLNGIIITTLLANDTDAVITFTDTYINKKGVNVIPFIGNHQEIPLLYSTRYAIQRFSRTVIDSNIADYVPNNDATNGFGNLSYTTNSMSENVVINHGKLLTEFTDTQLEILKNAGCVIIENNDNNTNAIYGADNSTYKQDVNGNETSLKSVASMHTYNNVNSYLFENVKSEFIGKTLNDGFQVGDTQQINLNSIKSSFIKYYDIMSTQDIDNNITYGWLSTNEVNRTKYIQTLERSLNINYTNGTVALSVVSKIISSLEKIIINSIISK